MKFQDREALIVNLWNQTGMMTRGVEGMDRHVPEDAPLEYSIEEYNKLIMRVYKSIKTSFGDSA